MASDTPYAQPDGIILSPTKPTDETMSELDRIAFRANNRAVLRFSALVDRDLILRWVSPSVKGFLGRRPEEYVNTPGLSHIHPDDLPLVMEVLTYELQIDPAARRRQKVRNVQDIRFRNGNGEWVTVEAYISNFLEDPAVGMLLVDVQASTQHNFFNNALEQLHHGAPLKQVVSAMLSRTTEIGATGIAGAVINADGVTIAASPGAPKPYGNSDRAQFAAHWTIDITKPGSLEKLAELKLWSPNQPHPITRVSTERAAEHLGLVLDWSRLHSELSRAALHDHLTGLQNRRSLEQRIEKMSRQQAAALVVYLDLDGFKGVNDTYGHAAGDEVLRTVGRRLREALRASEFVGRVGGDEFVVVCGDPTPPPEALAQRLALVVSAPIVFQNHVLQVHASIGMASGHMQGMNLVNLADQRMFEAKQKSARPARALTQSAQDRRVRGR
jgi:diguanylate cyclase (GGDEF)-like protein